MKGSLPKCWRHTGAGEAGTTAVSDAPTTRHILSGGSLDLLRRAWCRFARMSDADADATLPTLQDLPLKESARYNTAKARVLGEAWDPATRTVRVAGLTDVSRTPEAQLFLDTKPLGVPVVGVYRGDDEGYWILAKDDQDRILFPRRNLVW